MQEQALFQKMYSDSYFELQNSRAKSAHAPTISGPNIDRIQTKQARLAIQKQCAATVQLRNSVKSP